MKIYLAAAFERRAEMRETRDRLEILGHTVTSGWIDLPNDTKPIGVAELKVSPGQWADFAIADLHDVYNADVLIMFSGGGRGGRHTEFGYALALDKQLILIGDRENVFHALPGVMCFETTDRFFEHLVASVVHVGKAVW
jgi:nucleoside 2-deoxyribosyltransferase